MSSTSSGGRASAAWSNPRGAAVDITAWFCFCVVAIVVIAKVSVRYVKHKRSGVDDLLTVIAVLFDIGFTVCMNLAVAGGLGKSFSGLDRAHVDEFEKSMYSSGMLYVCALAFSKATTLRLAQMLSPAYWVKLAARLGYSFVAVWAVVSLFVLGFGCSLPHPWKLIEGKCIDKIAFWSVFAAIDILVEIALVAIPVGIMWDLSVSRKIKLFVNFAFGIRVVTIPLSILRVIYLDAYYASDDMTRTAFRPSLVTIIHLATAIVTTCIPFLKTFIESMQHGAMASALRQAPLTLLDNKPPFMNTNSISAAGYGVDISRYLEREYTREPRPMMSNPIRSICEGGSDGPPDDSPLSTHNEREIMVTTTISTEIEEITNEHDPR